MGSYQRSPLLLALACGAPCAAQSGLPPGIQELLHTQPLVGGLDTPGWLVNGQDIYFSGGHVGVGIGFPAFPVHIASATDRALAAQSMSLVGITYGGIFTTLSPDGRAVYGLSASTT